MDNKNLREPEKHGEVGRRPYERPAVSWEEDFEPYVYSTCAKTPGMSGPCAFNKKS